jgi:hypothetical protein
LRPTAALPIAEAGPMAQMSGDVGKQTSGAFKMVARAFVENRRPSLHHGQDSGKILLL